MVGSRGSVATGGARRAPERDPTRRTRPSRQSVAASLTLHALVLFGSGLLALVSQRDGAGGEAHEVRIELARALALELLDESEERRSEPLDPPSERAEDPELVEIEPAQEQPAERLPEEEVRPALDERFFLVDPLARTTRARWPERRAEPIELARAPAQRAEAAAPPPVAGQPAEPEVLEGPAPVYPRTAQRLGQQGSVELRAAVSAEGRVLAVEVIATSGHALLDEAARKKLLEWRFRPARPGEPAVRAYLKTFTFRLPS